MQIEISTDIEASVDTVWTLVADDFTSIQTWSASVVTSETLDVTGPQGAPTGGRYCTFTDDPNGFGAREKITHYDRENLSFSFDVEPVNAPKAIPLRRNHVTVTLESLGPTRTRLRWIATPELKPFGYLMYPLVKAGIRKSFRGIVGELKAYAEGRDGIPHMGAA